MSDDCPMWRVEEMTPDSHKISIDVVGDNWEQWVLLASDRHLDNPHSDRDMQLRHLRMAQERGAIVLDNGDLFDAMQGRNDPRRTVSGLRDEVAREDYFDALVEDAADFLAPFADNIAVLGVGNHESSALKHYHTHLPRRLGAALRGRASRDGVCHVQGYGGWIRFQFRMHKTQQQSVMLKRYHGSGGGGPVTKGVIQTNRRAVFLPDADIVWTGHIHESWQIVIPRERITQRGVIKRDYQHHVCTCTYLDDYGTGRGGWAVERGMPPKPLGAGWLRFFVRGKRIAFQAIQELG